MAETTPGRTPFLTAEQAAVVRERFGTPCYVYDQAGLEMAARRTLAVPAPFGLTLRYAMKANPSRGILTLFRNLGLHIDASSDHEVERALRAGFAPDAIQLTSQMPSRRLADHVARGVLFNACSLHQLELFARAAPGRSLAVRMNPGLGSGSTKRTNTGGPASSFGIWHEYLPEVKAVAAQHELTIRTLHSHIGSGTDPEVWTRAAGMTLDLAATFPTSAPSTSAAGSRSGRMPEEPTHGPRGRGGSRRRAADRLPPPPRAGVEARAGAGHVPGRAGRGGGRDVRRRGGYWA